MSMELLGAIGSESRRCWSCTGKSGKSLRRHPGKFPGVGGSSCGEKLVVKQTTFHLVFTAIILSNGGFVLAGVKPQIILVVCARQLVQPVINASAHNPSFCPPFVATHSSILRYKSHDKSSRWKAQRWREFQEAVGNPWYKTVFRGKESLFKTSWSFSLLQLWNK